MHSAAAADAICNGVCMQKTEEKILFAHFREFCSFRGFFLLFLMTMMEQQKRRRRKDVTYEIYKANLIKIIEKFNVVIKFEILLWLFFSSISSPTPFSHVET